MHFKENSPLLQAKSSHRGDTPRSLNALRAPLRATTSRVLPGLSGAAWRAGLTLLLASLVGCAEEPWHGYGETDSGRGGRGGATGGRTSRSVGGSGAVKNTGGTAGSGGRLVRGTGGAPVGGAPVTEPLESSGGEATVPVDPPPASGGAPITGTGGAPASGGSEPSGGGSPIPSETPPTPSSGCGSGVATARYYATVSVRGATRRFYVIPPRGTGVNEPVPLLIGYHWHDGTGQEMGDAADLRPTGGRVLAIYPDGVAQDFLKGGVAWDIRSNDSDDVALTSSIIDYAIANFCVDEGRVFAYGISWGGWMANQAGCALSGRLHGIAPVAGGGPNYPTSAPIATCNGPMPTIIFHGSNDADEPVASAYRSRDTWMRANTCAGGPTPYPTPPCVEYACAPGAPLVFCEHTDGHGLPTDWGMETLWSFLMSL